MEEKMISINKKIRFVTKSFLAFYFLFFSFLIEAVAESAKITINNEAQSSNQNQNLITAPALVPSHSDKIRDLRQKQELDTEDNLIKELEKQRLLDERKRFHSLFNKQEASSDPVASAPVTQAKRMSFFGERSFLSVGAGLMNYYNVPNINSTEMPTFLASFGAYALNGQLIFDTSFFYSTHYIKEIKDWDHNNQFRVKLNEPGITVALKWSFLKGKMKPYMGVTGALIARKANLVDLEGLASSELEQLTKDIASKSWRFSANAGVSAGADIALGEKLGLSVDVRYFVNIYTEDIKTTEQVVQDIDIVSERDVILASLNLKYYFL